MDDIIAADAAAAATDPPAAGIAAALAQGLALLEAGGPVVMILLALSVFALGLILAKAAQFAGLGDEARLGRETLRLWRERGPEPALRRAMAGRGPVALAAAHAIEARRRGEDPAQAREESWRLAGDALEALRGWLRPLEVAGALAPLLGLFGTVLGMIAAFAELQAAGDRVDPGVLSGGIWEALLTTAVGLAVAIPAVAAHSWFDRRVERLEHACDSLLTGLYASAPADPAAAGAVARRGLHVAG